MSKHLKQVRRERKKTDRARRVASRFRHPTSHIKHGAAALAAAAAIAAGTSAYASPVRFDNPARGEADHYEWVNAPSNNDVLRLDMVLPADQQTDVGGALSISQNSQATVGRVTSWSGNADIQVVDIPGLQYHFVAGVASETLIPSGLAWSVNTSFSWLDPMYGFGSGLLTDGEQTYLGVRFDLGSGTQYGWIGVVMNPADADFARGLDAFAWGYETEVGVPLAAGVPEPGTLALLAVGAVGLAGRRSRRQRHDN